jgi:hypothetical protein
VQYYRVLNVITQQESQRPAPREPRFRFWRKRPDTTDYSWYAAHLRLHNALR